MTSLEDRSTSLASAPPLRRTGPLRAWLQRRLFGISERETSFARRRFRCEAAAVRERLEEVGRCFVAGYNAALEEERPAPLAARLDDELGSEQRGFAYEGAGMALALLDAVIPGPGRRLSRFLAGPGHAHTYIVHVGAGWILARLPLSPERLLSSLTDPVLRWLALDGCGFHEGFFRWPRSVERREVPRKLHGYARRGFDQGLGRSLWFVEGADVRRLPRTVGAFPAERQADLWSGVGLACAYAGGRSREEVRELRQAAGPFAPQLAQGVAFAAKARERAANPAAHTELVCQEVWGLNAGAVAVIVDTARRDLPADRPEEPAFEVWRRSIQEQFSRGSTP